MNNCNDCDNFKILFTLHRLDLLESIAHVHARYTLVFSHAPCCIQCLPFHKAPTLPIFLSFSVTGPLLLVLLVYYPYRRDRQLMLKCLDLTYLSTRFCSHWSFPSVFHAKPAQFLADSLPLAAVSCRRSSCQICRPRAKCLVCPQKREGQ